MMKAQEPIIKLNVPLEVSVGVGKKLATSSLI